MGSALVHIVVSKYGKIDNEEVSKVFETMEECYGQLAPQDVSLVDLYLFERSSSVTDFFAKEYRKFGVVSAPFDEQFFAMHDAWRGIPRITLSFEKMKELPKLVRIGGIRHEVGHSVLHGNLRYYVLSAPPALLEIADSFNLSFEYMTNLLYLVSIAVKDYEVTRLLHQRGYVEDQINYAKHLLMVSEEEKRSWEMSRGTPAAKALCLTSYLKSGGCAAPFLLDKMFREEMKQCLMGSLSHLPPARSALLLKVIEEGFASLGTDTLENVALMIDKCKPLFEAVFNR